MGGGVGGAGRWRAAEWVHALASMCAASAVGASHPNRAARHASSHPHPGCLLPKTQNTLDSLHLKYSQICTG